MKKFKNPFSFQVDYDRGSIFKLASDKEKEEQTFMRPSTSFMGDAIRRFKRNKIAVISFFFIAFILVAIFVIPAFYPYTYDAMLPIKTGDETFIKKFINSSYYLCWTNDCFYRDWLTCY